LQTADKVKICRLFKNHESKAREKFKIDAY